MEQRITQLGAHNKPLVRQIPQVHGSQQVVKNEYEYRSHEEIDTKY